MNTANSSVRKEEEFDFKKILSRFLSQWKYYLLSLVLFIFLGFIFIRYSTPMYKVHSQLLVEDDQSKGGSSSSSFMETSMLQNFSGLFDMPSNVNNEMAILETNDLLEKAIKNLNYNVAYFKKGDIRDVEMFDKSPFAIEFTAKSDSIQLTEFTINFDNKSFNKTFSLKTEIDDFSVTGNVNQVIKTPVGNIIVKLTGLPFQLRTYSFTVNSLAAVVSTVKSNLTISIPDEQTTVIQMDYNTSLPRKGEALQNQLISEYLKRNLIQKNQISDSTIAFINSRIGLVSVDLSAIELDIQHFKQQNNIADLTAQSQALIANTTEYNNKLNEVEVQLNVVKTMQDYVSNQGNNNRPVPALLTTDPTFASLVQQYNLLIAQRNRLLLSVKENNPLTGNLDAQIAALHGDMIKSLQNQQKALQISLQQIQGENRQLGGYVQNVPAQERQYVNLSRERDVKQALYLYLLQKKEETAITKAANLPNASIIQQPKSEFLPYFPDKVVVGVATILLALILPTAIILGQQFFNNKILSREDITQATSVPILAEIGHNDTPILSMKSDSRSIIAEQFRVFRTNMDFIKKQKKCLRILITSSITGEGKSFIAYNLGLIYGYSGKKVLLTEFDLRKPRLSSMINMSNETGFSSYIISDKSHKDFIRPVPDSDNVFIMSSGVVPPNPAELFLSEKMETFMRQVEEEYDVIIMDTPPIGVVTDAQILAKYSDVNLYVIRQSYTFKNSLNLLNDIIDNQRIEKMYVVVNDVKKGATYGGYAYGYSYAKKYGYGYGYGYSETKKSNKK